MEPQENTPKKDDLTLETNHPEAAPQPVAGLSIPAAILTGAAMIALALIIILHPSNTAPSAIAPNGGTTQPTTPTVPVDSTKVNVTDEPFIGNPNAPVTMAYWFDYQCPFCKQDEESVLPQIITNYVNTGKVKIVFKDFAFLGPDSQTLGTYARAVFAVDPTNFYKWHKAIFDNQGQEGSGWATTSKLNSITTTTLGATEAAKVAQLVKTNAAVYQQAMDADKAEAEKFGIEGTPAAIIGTQEITGAVPYAQFQTALDKAVAGK